jgi:hypothetical protein
MATTSVKATLAFPLSAQRDAFAADRRDQIVAESDHATRAIRTAQAIVFWQARPIG